jgi:carbohydrate-selective porin OprB
VAVARANFSDAARDLDGLDDNEIAVEINYELPLTDWLTLQPNVQRIFTPGGDTALDDAWVVGSRFILTYSR